MALTKVTGQVIKNTTDVTVGVLTVTNTLAVGGTVSIGGTLTYEDVTNVDAVGLITARDGIKVGSGITLSVDGDGFFTGVITATSYSGIDLSDVTGATGDFSIADKIVHTGDTNTAIRFPAADTVTVETGGSERLRIDSSGKITTPLGTSNRIGISDRTSGTGAGGSLLVTAGAARGSSQTTGNLLLAAGRGNNSADNGEIRFGYNDGGDGTGLDQEHARIDSSGHFGVGLTPADSFSFGKAIDIGSTSGGFYYARDTDAGSDAVGGFGYSGSALYIGNEKSDGYIRFSTNTSATERMRIDSSGRVLIGTTTEGNSSADNLTVATSSDTGITIRSGTSSGGNIYFSDGTSGADEYRGVISYDHASNFMQFYTNASEAFRIESNTRVLIGHTANIIVGGHLARLQISGTDYNQSTVSIMANSNDANGAYLMLGHQRSGSAGGTTILNDDDEVGVIRFAACDGNDLAHPTAEIKSHVDGTPGENDMPGRLAFFTTADGGTSKLERMRIDSSGNITAPYQPAFSMYINNNQLSASYNTGTQTMPFGETNTNIGGHFKTSGTDQYKFVAPVAGQYFFALSQNHSSRVDTRILKNGNTFHGGENEIPMDETDGQWHHHTLTCIMTLAVGDKVHCTTNNQDGGSTYRAWNGGYWDNFSGYLIG